MKTRALLAASIFAMAAATSANAADILVQEIAVVAPAFSWSGLYIGGQIGGSWSDSSIDGYSVDGFTNNNNVDPSGFLAGLYAGFNWEFANNLVAGIETDLVWTDISKTDSQNYAALLPLTTDYTVQSSINQKWEGATRVRLGYAMDRWLPFIAGGVAYSKVKSGIGVYNVNDLLLGGDGQDTLVGWTAGAGVDYAIMDDLMLRLEYRYSDLNGETYATDTFGYNVDYATNEVRMGLAYKFN